MSKDKAAPINRRSFFGVAASGAAVTTLGVGAGVGMAGLGGGAMPAFAQDGDERTRARYRATDHVETFYRVNRYYPRGNN